MADRDPRWLPETEYRFICDRVPIVCVDLLPVLSDRRTFGLIERETIGGGRGLNLVGGGVLLDEAIPAAVERHIEDTLGEQVRLTRDTLEFVGVFQYYKTPKPGELHDPRKNAVALTYTGLITGDVSPKGEALQFHTFGIDEPPVDVAFGWDQGRVVYQALEHFRRSHYGAR